jgi:hypothetical protein
MQFVREVVASGLQSVPQSGLRLVGSWVKCCGLAVAVRLGATLYEYDKNGVMDIGDLTRD